MQSPRKSAIVSADLGICGAGLEAERSVMLLPVEIDHVTPYVLHPNEERRLSNWVTIQLMLKQIDR